MLLQTQFILCNCIAMNTLRDRVIHRMHKLGLNPTSLAKVLRLEYGLERTKQSTIQSLVSGRTKTFRNLTELAAALQTSVEWLHTGMGPEEFSLQSKVVNVREQVQFGPDTVPILGHANGSQDAVVLNMDSEIGRVLRHPKQQGMNNCFALYARGDSMYPRFKPRQILYAIKDMPVNKGDDCVIELINGESFVKEFVKITSKEIVCKQFHPDKEWKRPISDLKSIHAIVGTG